MAVISAILLALRQRFAFSERVFAVNYPHIVDHSLDNSHGGSSSYAGGDAESSQPAREQRDVCSRTCRHLVHHLPNADISLACYERHGAVVCRPAGRVLCGRSEPYSHHTQFGRHLRHHHRINRRFRDVLVENVCRRRSAIPVVTYDMMGQPETGNLETIDGSYTL